MKSLISDRVSNIIKALNLNNSSFAKSISVASTTIDGYTKGRSTKNGTVLSQPNYDVIQKIITIHKVNPYYIFGLSDEIFAFEAKTDLDLYAKTDILDYIIDNRLSFSKEPKIELLMDIFTSITRRQKIEETERKVEEIQKLLDKNKKLLKP